MVDVKAPSTKDLSRAIPKNWKHFDNEYCFKLV